MNPKPKSTINDVKCRIRKLGAFPAEIQSEIMQLRGAHPKAVGASVVVRNSDSHNFGMIFTYGKAQVATFSMLETTERYHLGKPLPYTRPAALLNALMMGKRPKYPLSGKPRGSGGDRTTTSTTKPSSKISRLNGSQPGSRAKRSGYLASFSSTRIRFYVIALLPQTEKDSTPRRRSSGCLQPWRMCG
jgi:hypothetical protein